MEEPRLMTVREIAQTGILTEYTLRKWLREGKLPVIYVGKKALINYTQLVNELSSLTSAIDTQKTQEGQNGKEDYNH